MAFVKLKYENEKYENKIIEKILITDTRIEDEILKNITNCIINSYDYKIKVSYTHIYKAYVRHIINKNIICDKIFRIIKHNIKLKITLIKNTDKYITDKIFLYLYDFIPIGNFMTQYYKCICKECKIKMLTSHLTCCECGNKTITKLAQQYFCTNCD